MMSSKNRASDLKIKCLIETSIEMIKHHPNKQITLLILSHELKNSLAQVGFETTKLGVSFTLIKIHVHLVAFDRQVYRQLEQINR